MISKRDIILKAAVKLFAEKGFDGTSVRKIAQDSGLSVPGMFHYFPNKEEILYEIMIGFMEKGYQTLMDIYGTDKDPLEKLEAVCKFYVEYYAGHKDYLTILVSEEKSLLKKHRQIFLDKQRIYVNALKRVFEDLAKAGQLKSLNPSVLAFIFFGMTHWTHKWYSPKDNITPDELGNIISDVFLRGILKNQA